MALKVLDPTPGWAKPDGKVKTLNAGDSAIWASPDSDVFALDARPGWSKPEIGLSAGDLPVGTPGNDTLVKYLTLFGAPIVWRVIGKNLPGMPADSITLFMDKIVVLRCFDAKEPKNSDNSCKGWGNNDWAVSNLRQWANSSASAGNWYQAQHNADAPPDTDANCGGYNAYQADAGMLYESTQAERDLALATTRNYTDYRGNLVTSVDKLFPLTSVEVGLESIAGNGTKIPYFTDNNSRITQATALCVADTSPNPNITALSDWGYWLQTSGQGNHSYLSFVTYAGILSQTDAYRGDKGVRLACNIPANALILPEPDKDGCYLLAA